MQHRIIETLQMKLTFFVQNSAHIQYINAWILDIKAEVDIRLQFTNQIFHYLFKNILLHVIRYELDDCSPLFSWILRFYPFQHPSPPFYHFF